MVDFGFVVVLFGEFDCDYLVDLYGWMDCYIDLDVVVDFCGVDLGIGGFWYVDGWWCQVWCVDGGWFVDVVGGVYGNFGDQFVGDQWWCEWQVEVVGVVDGDCDWVGGVVVDYDMYLIVWFGGVGQQCVVGVDVQQWSGWCY